MRADMVRLYDGMFQRMFQQALMAPGIESPLRAVFTALGTARVVRGARALYVDVGGWDDCFLALAYGEAGELQRMIPNSLTTSHGVSRILGISVEDVKILIHHFDSDPKHFTFELMQWLRARGADATTVLALAACEVDAERRRLAAECQGESSAAQRDGVVGVHRSPVAERGNGARLQVAKVAAEPVPA